jgi:hypothetical protein
MELSPVFRPLLRLSLRFRPAFSLMLIIGLTLCCSATPTVRAQGFGRFEKSKLTLHRKLPPVLHFTGSAFNIKVATRDQKYAELTGTLKDLLETELLKDNEKFKVDANSPELIVSCTVVSFEVPPPQPFTRNEVVVEKGKQIEQPVKYNKIAGALEISYQALDGRTGRALDADNISVKYSEDFEQGTNQQSGKSLPTKAIDPFKRMAGKKTEDSSGPPSAPELRDKLMNDAVREIASRITVTDEPVVVMLAEGKFDRANKLAETGLWTRDLEELEQMTPLSDPKEDSYRLYNIGVAYEALAYQSEDRQTAKKMLQEAAINYGKAVDAKREEKYFLQPQKRIETAMIYYRKIESQQKAVDAANSPAASSNIRSPSAAAMTAASPAKDSPGTVKPAASAGAKPAPKSVNAAGPSTAAAAKPSAPSPAPAPASTSSKPPGAAKPPAAPALTNAQIIKMSKAGVDEDSIVATIQDASSVNFDISPEGQIELTTGGVKPKILAAMRLRLKSSSHRAASAN